MKSIVCVNTEIPTVKDELDFNSHGSLRDYDIIVFDPALPWLSRIEFTGGGSCLSIESASLLSKAWSHWSRELSDALAAGKTVFVVLSEYEQDAAATGSSMSAKNSRTYNTQDVNNYAVLPAQIKVRNSRGRHVVVKDPAFQGLYEAVKDITEYRVVLEPSTAVKAAFSAKDGTTVGGVVRFQTWPGALVLIPHFDFQAAGCVEVCPNPDGEEEEVWSTTALRASNALVGQLVAIDRMLSSSAELSPPPDWVAGLPRPKAVDDIEASIAAIDARIDELRHQREIEAHKRTGLLEYAHLLYETGKPLERAIEKVLRLLGYTVDTLRIGDLEIDHVIVGPSGVRMIGESEGKDSSAIDISKFRQLESNIGEDFEREEVVQPAKGLLFGNGFRLSQPDSRAEQFTQKSLTNAKRLGSALIRTADLYAVATHLLDHSDDEAFRTACRAAIEETSGGIVIFPRASSAT